MIDEKNINPGFRSGFVAIVGRPNVGKSTLINKILGEKISIISPKPQTTRHQIKGIFSDETRQIIFLDTPGFLKPRYELQERMHEYIRSALTDADLILFLTDVRNYPTDFDQDFYQLLNNIKTPKILVFNKIDLVNEKTTTEKIDQARPLDFDKILQISALKQQDFSEFLDLIEKYLPFGGPFYDPDEISDLPLRFFVQEIIREQIFLAYREEIPYAATVTVESFKELPNKIEIAANIWLERKSQKPILIGSKGQNIKDLRLKSEKEIYKILGKRARLDLWVKIKPGWRKKKNALKEFGYR